MSGRVFSITGLADNSQYQMLSDISVVQCSSEDAAKTMVQALVISRLEYCNALCYGITNELMHCLQSVQNAATKLVMGTRRCDHISPVLRQLHWLPVWQHIMFKIAILVYQSLSGNAPGYLADDCQLIVDARVRQLRSADTRTLVVSQTCRSFGYRTFAAAGLQIWNSLLPNLRRCGCHTPSLGGY